MKRLNNKGFSLIEILGAMVILGILFSISISAYTKYRKSAAEQSYETMSINASSAAEEYFMDNTTKSSVTFQTLIDEDYLENTVDPLKKDEICTGTVDKFNVVKGSKGSLDKITTRVTVSCYKYESCMLYPDDITCDKEDGITTDGATKAYSLGLENYDFGNSITLVIRLKFNKLTTGKAIEYFGNWENAGGGLGIDTSDRFYINYYSTSDNNYHAFNTSKVAYTDSWYTVVGVVNNGTITMYVNGEQLKSSSGATYATLPGNIKASTEEILVGGNPSPNGNLRYPANITVSNAIVYNRGLSAAEVGSYFNSSSNLVNYPNDYLVAKTFTVN
jgi:prepilin-type N-terminal cleavage/methylation domain-containing protein